MEITALKSSTSFRWITHTWRHLGVFIPVQWRNLYKENFRKLYQEAQTLLDCQMKSKYSWLDRIAIVKTFITSRFLFVTRMLPIVVPIHDLRQWQWLVNNFIWGQKRHRIAHTTLRIPHHKGGLGIPDITLYYDAANLTMAYRILTSETEMNWMTIGTLNTKNYSARDVLWLSKSDRK